MNRVDPAVALAYVEHLTPREADCLFLMACGLRTGTIATRLGISISTVKGYVLAAREKLGARTATHAVALALRDGRIAAP